MAKVELFIADKYDLLEDMSGRIKMLEEDIENVKWEMQGMVNESAYDLQHKWEILSQSLTAALDAMKAEFEVMKGEWALMKRAVANAHT